MGNGLRIGGIVLGVMALLWSVLLFGIYSLLAAVVGGSTILIAPIVGFVAGVLAIAGGILGVKRAEFGALLVLAAGVIGILAATAPLLLAPQVNANFFEFLIAYLAVGWWAILMVILGGIARFGPQKVADTSTAPPSSPRD